MIIKTKANIRYGIGVIVSGATLRVKRTHTGYEIMSGDFKGLPVELDQAFPLSIGTTDEDGNRVRSNSKRWGQLPRP